MKDEALAGVTISLKQSFVYITKIFVLGCPAASASESCSETMQIRDVEFTTGGGLVLALASSQKSKSQVPRINTSWNHEGLVGGLVSSLLNNFMETRHLVKAKAKT